MFEVFDFDERFIASNTCTWMIDGVAGQGWLVVEDVLRGLERKSRIFFYLWRDVSWIYCNEIKRKVLR